MNKSLPSMKTDQEAEQLLEQDLSDYLNRACWIKLKALLKKGGGDVARKKVQEKGLKWVKRLAPLLPEAWTMYPKKESKKSTVESLKIPNEWKPKEENRWVIMSEIIPWEKFEEEYAPF